MGTLCGCPLGPSLENLAIPECMENLGQIQKAIFQRISGADGLNGLPLSESGTRLTKSSMETFLSAKDATKIVISPYINNPTTEPGAARTFGGGNQTPDGIEIVLGREPTTFTSALYQMPQSVIKTLKTYQCENVGVYLIDGNGAIAGLKSGTKLMPIPIRGLFVGDKKLGGFDEVDSNALEWKFNPDWSDDLYIVKPSEMDFNALTELSNPVE